MNSDFSDFIRFFPIFRLYPTFRLLDSTTLISDLKATDLTDPAFAPVLRIVKEKITASGQECILREDSRCALRIVTSGRTSRAVSKMRNYLTTLIGNVTRQTFPKVATIMTDIFSNTTSVGEDTVDQFETTSTILVLKMLERTSQFLAKIHSFKAPVLILLTLILVFTTVFLTAGLIRTCSEYQARRKTARLQKYEAYFTARQRALEL